MPRRPAPPAELPSLSYRQRLFVVYFLGDSQGNATDAARRAGYGSPNVQGSRLLANVSIRAAIDARLASAALSADEVMARLSEQASVDVGDFLTFDSKGRAKLSLDKARRANKLHLVRKLTPTRDGLKVELVDSQRALELLGRYHGIFDRSNKNNESATASDALSEAESADQQFSEPENPDAAE